MAALFSKPKRPRAPVAPQVDDTAAKEAQEEARRKERLIQRKKAGRASTILTSGLGNASVTKKTLLGE